MVEFANIISKKFARIVQTTLRSLLNISFIFIFREKYHLFTISNVVADNKMHMLIKCYTPKLKMKCLRI